MTMNTNDFRKVSLIDFVNHPTDSEDDCIHVVPNDDGTITFVRLVESVVEGADENVRIKTVVDGAFNSRRTRVSYHGNTPPSSICYHAGQAATVMLWLRSLARERGEATVTLAYWERNDSPALEKAGVHNESLFLRYVVNDRVEEAQINDAYTTPAHMSARWA